MAETNFADQNTANSIVFLNKYIERVNTSLGELALSVHLIYTVLNTLQTLTTYHTKNACKHCLFNTPQSIEQAADATTYCNLKRSLMKGTRRYYSMTRKMFFVILIMKVDTKSFLNEQNVWDGWRNLGNHNE